MLLLTDSRLRRPVLAPAHRHSPGLPLAVGCRTLGCRYLVEGIDNSKGAITSCSGYLLSTYGVPDTMLGIKRTEVHKTVSLPPETAAAQQAGRQEHRGPHRGRGVLWPLQGVVGMQGVSYLNLEVSVSPKGGEAY